VTTIVNRGAPNLTLKRPLQAHVTCPNCNEMMEIDANDVDIGNIVKCEQCNTNTYYPFEKPWYRRGKLLVGFALSIALSFVLGLTVNYTYDTITKAGNDRQDLLSETQE
jgi:hypothetical protein